MSVMKKFFKDKDLKELILEYDGLRADFNNNTIDCVSFNKEACDLKKKFEDVNGNYSNSNNNLITGYIFNINDFIIRNNRLLDAKQKAAVGMDDKSIKAKINPKSTIVFSNEHLNNSDNGEA